MPRRSWVLGGVIAALAYGGAGHVAEARARRAEIVEGDQATLGHAFAVAYTALREGAKRSVIVGNWAMERVGDASIRVAQLTRADRAARMVTDDALVTGIQSKLILLHDVDTAAVQVEVRHGVVTLRGRVPDAQTARVIIATVLETPGVRAVVSELLFPGVEGGKVITPGEPIRPEAPAGE